MNGQNGGPLTVECSYCGAKPGSPCTFRWGVSELRGFHQARSGDWPRGAPQPAPEDIVQVLMPARMLPVFERRCLPIAARLAGPLLFSEDDVPSYIIEVPDA